VGLIDKIAALVPWQALLIAGFLLLVLDRTGFFQRLLRRGEQRRVTERERLSEDTQTLIDSMRAQAEQEHGWRTTDATYYLSQIAALRTELMMRDTAIAQRDATIATLAETGRLSERGNARLRHALNNAFQYISSLRVLMIRAGTRPAPFNGWQDLLGLTPDLDQHLREMYGENGVDKKTGD
jgi:hypothetical protein